MCRWFVCRSNWLTGVLTERYAGRRSLALGCPGAGLGNGARWQGFVTPVFGFLFQAARLTFIVSPYCLAFVPSVLTRFENTGQEILRRKWSGK